MVGTNLEAKIKERAYQLWEGEGRPHGKHLEHWRRAEQEVKSQADQSILQRSMEQPNPVPRTSPAGAPSKPAGTTVGTGESKAAAERKRTKTKAAAKTKAEPKGKTSARRPRSGTTKPTV